MQNLLFVVLAVLALVGCGSPPPPSVGSLAVPQMKMAGEFKAVAPQALAIDHQGRFFVGQADGSVQVIDQNGAKAFALATRDDKGQAILKSPSGIAISEEVIYVTDQDRDRVAVFGVDGRHLYSFGTSGNEPKEFDSPQGIAVHGNVVYVADTDNGRLQVFGANGVFLRAIDGAGPEVPAEKRLIEPIAVAVGPQGHLYVVDADDHRIKIFTGAGDFIANLPLPGKPGALVMAADGFLIADQTNLNISKYNFDNKLLFSFGSEGTGRAQFLSLAGLAADGHGLVLAADKERGLIQSFALETGEPYPDWRRRPPPASVVWQRTIDTQVEKAAWDGQDTLYAIAGETKSILTFKGQEKTAELRVPDCTPKAVAVDPAGFPWVVDYGNRRVLKLDRQGKILLAFGSYGSGAGNFSKPTDLAITSDGIIHVADRGNSRVQTFSSEGVYLNVIRAGQNGVALDSPIALSLAVDNTLYVLDSGTRLVTAFSPTGQVLASFGGQGGLAQNLDDPVDLLAHGHEIHVLDAGAKTVKVFDRAGKYIRQYGSPGKGPGDLHKPSALTGLAGHDVAISDPGNRRLQVLTTIPTPEQPTEFAAVAGMRTVTLAWRKNPEPYGIVYRISRAERENGPFSTLAESKDDRYTDRDVSPQKTRFYLLTALAENGNRSQASPVVSATPTTYRPAAPAGLTAETREWSLALKWDPGPAEFFSHYRIYRQTGEGAKIVGKSLTPEFTERSLSPNTTYKYTVAAVSIDEEESPGTAIAATTKVATKPPLEINVLEMSNIFSNTYKIYEEQGLGKISVTNNMGDPVVKLKLTFAIKDFMDFPWETEIEELGADQTREFLLKAVLNNSILNVTEDTPVQTQIKASYYENNQAVTFNRNHTITIFEKHRMMWDLRGRFGTFITPKDPLVLDFVRSVVSQFGSSAGSIQHAAALFDAFGLLGLAYMQDPSNPYQITSGKTDLIDYIQYPRETLQRKSGDCDDLVALYCSALESLGIRTLVVEVPGHMFMMLDTGLEAEADTDTMNNLFVAHDGRLWLPVETTLVGGPFVRAWEQGSNSYYQWLEKKGLTLLDIRAAWSTFKPASLPHAEWRPPAIGRHAMEERFADDFRTIRKLSIRLKNRSYFERLAADPNDSQTLLQVGIVYARAGEAEEALAAFTKLLALEPGHAAAQNNAGNAYYVLNRFEEAAAAYELAGQGDPGDPLVWVNLARCYRRLAQPDKAKAAFKKAQELDANVAQRFRTLALELESVLLPYVAATTSPAREATASGQALTVNAGPADPSVLPAGGTDAAASADPGTPPAEGSQPSPEGASPSPEEAGLPREGTSLPQEAASNPPALAQGQTGGAAVVPQIQ